MLRDSSAVFVPSQTAGGSETSEIDDVIAFVDDAIHLFPDYYAKIKDSGTENRISDMLVRHFQLCKIELRDSYFPFDFVKGPTQAISTRETDIGVYTLTRDTKPATILEFEAKRFSESSNNQQYVHGAGRGGIERFKRGEHSSHLSTCGMFGYVQKPTCTDWIAKVNEWIRGLADVNTDTTIDWIHEDEKLISVASFAKVEKLSSKHSRKHSSDTIFLWHYFIDLN